MSLQCRDCRDGWEHCHGTVIQHPQRRSECTQDDCDSPDRIPHTFSIDCAAVGCRCGQSAALAM
ncbi:MAG: hypothetical protein JO044_03720 [Mycobacteriaceae bacterium]|nr:hypothetical protein [Mycobacteriaceae bacterium]MBV9640165.1 hypothetical protein [Mycobacteriaceae bacterium]